MTRLLNSDMFIGMTIESVHIAVGLRIRMLRETLGLTQKELSDRLDKLDRTSLTNIEAGRQRLQLQTVEKVAAALGTNTRNLMKGIWW